MRLKQNWIAAATWLSLLCGILLRFRQLLIGRSLWHDEARLALNIVGRSYAQLMGPLDYQQGAPLLFLWSEKGMTDLFGNGEYALRLLPFLAGLAALLLFPLIARQYQTPRAALWGTLLFAFSAPLIYYSSEVKQYASDILATLLALLLFLQLISRRLRPVDALWMGLAGVILIYSAHAAIFTLASAALIAAAVRLHEKERSQLLIVFTVGAIWLAGFAANLLLSLADLANNQVLLNFWQGGFPPQGGGTAQTAVWVYERFLELFSVTLEMTFPAMAAVLYLLGLLVMTGRRWPLALSLFLPLLLTLLAAFLGRYPFFGRLMIFAFPLLYILIAEGLDRLLVWPAERRGMRYVGAALTLIFLAPVLLGGLSFITRPDYEEDIKPAIRYIHENRRAEDAVYLYYASKIPYAYYSEWYPIAAEYLIQGEIAREEWGAYEEKMAQLASEHERLWLLFSHVHTGEGGLEETIMLDALAQAGGRQEAAFAAVGATAYLYTFPP